VAGPGDGAVLPRVVCNPAGYVDYTLSVTKLQVGFPYYSAFQDLRPMLPAKGSGLGLFRKIEKSWMLVYRSMGGWIGQNAPADPLDAPGVNQGGTLVNFWKSMQTYGIQQYGTGPSWVNGIIPIDNAGAADANGQVYICINDPVPFNLVALTTRFALSEI